MTDPTPPDDRNQPPRVVVLSRDLFFGMRIRNALKQMGYETVLAKDEADFAARLDPAPALALIDFNGNVNWTALSATLAGSVAAPVIAFGAHTDTDGFRRAREAGVTRVISNGAFSAQLPELVEKYAITT